MIKFRELLYNIVKKKPNPIIKLVTNPSIKQLRDFIRKFFKILGIDISFKITYPMTNITIKAKCRHYWWERVEKSDLELNCLKVLLKNIGRKEKIIEVGSFIGTFTLLLSNLVGPEGTIYAFEPDSRALLFLEQNVRRNHIKNIIITKTALSNKVGKSYLYYVVSPGSSGSTLIPQKHIKNHNHQKEVEDTTHITYDGLTVIKPQLKEINSYNTRSSASNNYALGGCKSCSM